MATTSIGSERTIQKEKVDYSRLLWAGPLAMVGAGIANVIVRELAVLMNLIPQDHGLLQALAVFFSTVIQVGIGVAVFALLGKFAKRPISTFRIVAIVALILSLTNPIMVATGAFVLPGMSSLTFNVPIVLTMMLMHVVAGLIAIWVLTTQARKA